MEWPEEDTTNMFGRLNVEDEDQMMNESDVLSLMGESDMVSVTDVPLEETIVVTPYDSDMVSVTDVPPQTIHPDNIHVNDASDQTRSVTPAILKIRDDIDFLIRLRRFVSQWSFITFYSNERKQTRECFWLPTDESQVKIIAQYTTSVTHKDGLRDHLRKLIKREFASIKKVKGGYQLCPAGSDTLARPERITIAHESQGTLPTGQVPCYFDDRYLFSRHATIEDLRNLHQRMSWAGSASSSTSNPAVSAKRRRQESSPTTIAPTSQVDEMALQRSAYKELFCSYYESLKLIHDFKLVNPYQFYTFFGLEHWFVLSPCLPLRPIFRMLFPNEVYNHTLEQNLAMVQELLKVDIFKAANIPFVHVKHSIINTLNALVKDKQSTTSLFSLCKNVPFNRAWLAAANSIPFERMEKKYHAGDETIWSNVPHGMPLVVPAAHPMISHVFYFQEDLVPCLIEGDGLELIEFIEVWTESKRFKVFSEKGKRTGFFFLDAATVADMNSSSLGDQLRFVWREDVEGERARATPKVISLMPRDSKPKAGVVVVGRHLSWVNDQVLIGVPSPVTLPARRLAASLLVVHMEAMEGIELNAMLCSTVRVKSVFPFGWESPCPLPPRNVIDARTWHLM